MWSNFGYVALGVLFILLAARRQIKYRAIEEYNLKLKDPSCRTGIPQHFGIYYTIGRYIHVQLVRVCVCDCGSVCDMFVSMWVCVRMYISVCVPMTFMIGNFSWPVEMEYL